MNTLSEITKKITGRKHLRDYIFWISVLFYLDPGGYIMQIIDQRIAKNILLLIIWSVFLISSKAKGIEISLRNRRLRLAHIYILIWVFYFLLVFVIVKDEYTSQSISEKLLKTRLTITGWLLFIPIYYFTAYRSSRLFLKLFNITTIYFFIVMMLTVLTGQTFVYLHTLGREFVDVQRVLLDGYGFIEFGLYLLIGYSIIPMKKDILYRRGILLSSISAYLIYIISITRRYFLFAAIAIVLGFVISKRVIGLKSKYQSQIIVLIVSVFILTLLISPAYISGVVSGFKTISLSEEEEYGTTRDRMSLFAHEATVNIIRDNPFLGTGYINQWYSNTDVENYGLEGADYVFISTIGMYGFIGILLFLPFYFIITKEILVGLKFIKQKRNVIFTNLNITGISLIIFISSSIFFLRHLFTYPDWFAFIGPHSEFEKYYIGVGLIMGALVNLKLLVSSVELNRT